MSRNAYLAIARLASHPMFRDVGGRLRGGPPAAAAAPPAEAGMKAFSMPARFLLIVYADSRDEAAALGRKYTAELYDSKMLRPLDKRLGKARRLPDFDEAEEQE